MKKYKIFIVTFLFFFCNILFAQKYQKRIYTYKSGLSQNNISSIFEDSKGNIWIGTLDGLNKFDGNEFVKYRPNNTNLGTGQIDCIAEDKYGNLFIGTYLGVYFYNINDDSFIYLSKYNKDLEGGCKNIFIDSNENIWFCKFPKKIVYRFRFDYKKKKIKSFYSYETLLGDKSIKDIKQVGEKIVFIGKEGLYFYNLKNNTFESDFTEKDCCSLSVVSDSTFLLSIVDKGVFSYDIKSKKIKKLISLDGDIKVKYKNHNIYYTNKKGVYFANYDSLILGYRNIKCIEEFYYPAVNSMCVTQKGIIWLGLLRDGLVEYFKSNNNFDLFQGNKLRHISCIYEDNNNELWLGTEGYGLLYYGKKTLKARYEKRLFDEEIVYDVKYSNKSKKYYAAVYYKGVAESSSHFDKYDYIPNTETARKILVDGNFLWIALYNKGLLRYNTLTRESQLFNSKDGLSSCIVRNIIKDRYGNIWVATDKGLSFIKRNQRLTKKPIISGTDSISKNKYVLSLLEDSDGFLWFGTIDKGLFKCSFTRKGLLSLVEKYTSDTGLASNNVNDILEDDIGNIWIASNIGIQVIDKRSNSLFSFNKEDGLQDYEFGELASLKLSSGKLLFGGVCGVNSFSLSNLNISNEKKTPYLIDFSVNNISQLSDSVKSKILFPCNISKTKKISLNNKQRNICFKFSTLEFIKPNKIKYKYILKGYNEKWIYTNSNNKAEYYNLPIGKYVFIVKASNTNGIWSDKSLKINLEIKPSLWGSYNAKIFYIIISIIIFILLIFWSSNYIKRCKRRKYFESNTKFSENLLRIKTEFFNNISHEIRTPLTLIISPLEKIMNMSEVKQNSCLLKPINTAYKNSMIMFDFIDEYLNYCGEIKEQIDAKIEIFDIVKYCEDILNQFTYFAESRDVRLIFECECESKKIAFNKTHLRLIIYNLLSNAIKHTLKEKNVILSLSFENDELMVISVQDKGKGMSDELMNHIFEKSYKWDILKNKSTGIGMYFIKKIVDNLKGKIKVQTQVDEGSVFYVYLPMIKEKLEIDQSNKFSEESSSIKAEEVKSSDMAVLDLLDKDVFKIKNAKMLIVDDNNDILNIVNDLFESAFQIINSDNVYDAIDKAIKYCPDVIITGITNYKKKELQNSDFDLSYCVKLKTNPKTSHIPIILISNKINNSEIANVYGNMVDILCKEPFHNKTLVNMVESLLKNRKILIDKFLSKSTIKPIEKSISLSDYDFINRLSCIVEKNIDNSDFTAYSIEEEMGLSRYLLSKKLKEIYNISPSVYLRDMRLNKASEMLKTGKYLVSEVTYAVGFNDLTYFRKCFKNKFGVLPNSFKKSEN